MISDSAKRSVSDIFVGAARSSLVLDAGDRIRVEPLAGAELAATPGGQLLVFTIANFAFKLLVIFQVEADPATAQYFSRPDAGLGFDDVFPELGNLCCGAINRSLGQHFAHLGMSTPYALDSQCLPFLDVLQPGHLARHRIVIEDAVVLHATLCLCAYAPVDFRYDAREPVVETGGLELF